MRALFCLALLVGCVDDSTNNHEDLAVSTEDLRVFIHLDLSGRPEDLAADEDLRGEPDAAMSSSVDMKVLNGCNGLVGCYGNCQMSDPTACFAACDTGATARAHTLFNTATDCEKPYCFDVNWADSGAPACQNDSDISQTCNDCISNLFAPSGPCYVPLQNCYADKP